MQPIWSLYLASSAPPLSCPPDRAQERRALLAELRAVWDAVAAFLKSERSQWLEARSWLVATLGSVPRVGLRVLAAALGAFLPASVRVRASHGSSQHESGKGSGSSIAADVQLALMQLLCEQRREQVASLLSDCPHIFRSFFDGSPERVLLWFSHLSMEGLHKAKYGARALGHYVLAERDEAWEHLVWTGRHPQAPVTVATKTHYLCELDLVHSVANLLKAHGTRGLLASEPWRACLASGEFLDLDLPWFCKSLVSLLHEDSGPGRRLASLLEDWLLHGVGAWKLVTQRLMHLLPDATLLDVVREMAEEEDSERLEPRRQQALKDVAGRRWDDLSGLVLWASSTGSGRPCCAEWESLEQVVVLHALACCRQQLWKLVQDMEPRLAEPTTRQDSDGDEPGKAGVALSAPAVRVATLAAGLHGPASKHTAQAHTELLAECSQAAMGHTSREHSRSSRQFGRDGAGSNRERGGEQGREGSSKGSGLTALSTAWSRCLLALEAWTLRAALLVAEQAAGAAGKAVAGEASREEGEVAGAAAGGRTPLEAAAAAGGAVGLSCVRVTGAASVWAQDPSIAPTAAVQTGTSGSGYALLESEEDNSEPERGRKKRGRKRSKEKRRNKVKDKHKHRKKHKRRSSDDDWRGSDSPCSPSSSEREVPQIMRGAAAGAEPGMQGAGAVAPIARVPSMYRLQLSGSHRQADLVMVGDAAEVADLMVSYACKTWLRAAGVGLHA